MWSCQRTQSLRLAAGEEDGVQLGEVERAQRDRLLRRQPAAHRLPHDALDAGVEVVGDGVADIDEHF